MFYQKSVGSVFGSLWKLKRILGPPYIILCAEKKLPLPSVTRPANCQVMRNLLHWIQVSRGFECNVLARSFNGWECRETLIQK